MGMDRSLSQARRAPPPGDDPRGAAVARLVASEGGPLHALILGAASNSSYLAMLCERHADWLRENAAADAAAVMRGLLDDASPAEDANRAALMARLRIAKAKAALLIALADLGGLWSLEDVTQALTDLADSSVRSALAFLLREAVTRGKLPAEAADPATSGYFILALGKHGAGELNYSSDIDLICLFDPDRLPGADRGALQQGFVRLTRDLVQILSERTRDGYVFRTDLRLRPDPGAMPMAISVLTAETYYEGLGRTWERLAYIKARICAGDETAGDDFLAALRPFVWRRHLDFATLSEVRALKARINSHFGHGALAVAGHDLKRGRGGIREVEFYAQTQQIIFGGRDESLRLRETVTALDALVEAGWTDATVRDDLHGAYRILRDLEHRLQMLADMQTQTLPEPGPDLDRVARLAGDADGTALSRRLMPVLGTVSRHFDALFARLPGGEAETVAEPAEGSIAERLARLGFARPDDGAGLIDVWMQGRYPAMRGERSREMLRGVLPALLESLAASPDPDRGLARLDAAFSRLPTGLQFFAMLAARPKLIELITETAGLDAPLAEHLARNPDVLGAALEPDFWTDLPVRATHEAELRDAIGADRSFEPALDAVRRYHAGAHFRIGTHVLRGLAPPDEAGRAFTALAEACIATLLPVAQTEVERRHGTLQGGGLAVVAMGRMGAGEMTAASDLDLLFVAPGDMAAMTEGHRPVSRERWSAALGQTLVTALTSPTAVGRLYDVDMRLRPSGKSGPLVTTLPAFAAYHAGTAQTWEALARTRARVIVGPDALVRDVKAAIAVAQSHALPPASTAREVRDMRALIAKERRPRGAWDVKLRDGGLFDLEFTAQLLQIVRACPAEPHTARAIDALRLDGALGDGDARALLIAHRDYSALLQFTAVAAPELYDPDTVGQRVRDGVARAFHLGGNGAVTAKLAAHGEVCARVFAETVDRLAADGQAD